MQNPKNNKKTKKRHPLKWFAVIAATFFVLLATLTALAGWYQKTNRDKVLLGVSVAGENLGGLTKKQAYEILEKLEEKIIDNGLYYYYKDKEINIPPALVATDPNLAHAIFLFETDKTVDKAYSYGRNKNPVVNIFSQLKLLRQGKDFTHSFYLNEEELLGILHINFDEQEQTPENAKLFIDDSLQEIKIIDEKEGWIFDYQKVLEETKKSLSELKSDKIELTTIQSEPTVKKNNISPLLQNVKNILATTTPTLVYENNSWPIRQATVADWVEVQEHGIKDYKVGFNKEKFENYINSSIKDSINIKPIDAIFKLEGNKVHEFRPSKNGLELNIEKSYEKLQETYLEKNIPTVELVVDIKKPKSATEDLNELGIVELLGTGFSSFKGSPTNRRHNISIGTNSLNGILVPPGEEFSMLDSLGEIDGETGYLQELVIKGNRTLPEYGGGLCQVSTTMFRAALHAGLPITQRKNHSYRVIYYEPAGIDATIYNPAPDFRFLNDTGHHILVTTKIEGDDLYYEIYGTNDGRITEVPEKAEIYNVSKPGPVKIVETDDLAPGEKKRVERAINGADTKFDYKVTYPDGRVKEKTFVSHYVAWPEVWLVGKDPTKQFTVDENGNIIETPLEPETTENTEAETQESPIPEFLQP